MSASFDWLKRDAAGLVQVVAQDRHSGRIRMVAFANEEALLATLRTGEAHFFSRSRARLWRKGEESGNVLRVCEVWADCDADCLVYLVDPEGPSCHTGRDTCFFRRVLPDGTLEQSSSGQAAATLDVLWEHLLARQDADAASSYTQSLLADGAVKIGGKLREEAAELAEATAGEAPERVVSEAADVIYHLLVALLYRELSLSDVQAELARRFGVSGHAEKAARSRS